MTDDRATPQQLREDYSFAFQPIVDVDERTVWAYEALVRGPNGESAASVLGQFEGDDLLVFDHEARLRAIKLAASLGYKGRLSVNMLNRQSGERDLLAETVAAAVDAGFKGEDINLEVSEKDEITDLGGFLEAVRPVRSMGAVFALDDFGAGYSGLNLLAQFQPNFIKLDIVLVQHIHNNGPRQAIVQGVLRTCVDLGIEVIAEGVEDEEDFEWLWNAGVRLFQGYLLARPGFETLPTPTYPAITSANG